MMVTYLTVNTILTVLALGGLYLLSDSPPRHKLWLCLLALSIWLVPWQLLSVPLSPNSVALGYVEWLPAEVLNRSAPTSGQPAVMSWNWAAIACGAIGLSMFVLRVTFFRRRVARLRRNATSGNELLARHEFHSNAVVWVTPELNNAFVSGYFKHEIWIGESLAHSSAVKSTLHHEIIHIEQHDNLVLLFVALVKDLFWWNPLTRVIAKRAKEFVELSCDRRCQAAIRHYQTDLAEQVMNSRPIENAGLVSPIFASHRFNIFRIQQLDKELKLKYRHLFIASGIFVISAAVVLLPAIGVSASSQDDILVRFRILTERENGSESHLNQTFVGEAVSNKLVSLAEAEDAEVSVRFNDENNVRRILIQSPSLAATERILSAFDGTDLEGLWRHDGEVDPKLVGTPILIDLTIVADGSHLLQTTLAANDGEWSGVAVGDHIVRILPRSITGRRPNVRSIRLDTEISSRGGEDGYQVVARPRAVTEFGSSAEFGLDAGGVRFSLTMSVREPE